MKVIDYCDRTFGIGTNPSGGIYVVIQPETPQEKKLFGGGREIKINERLVSYPGDGRIPMDGGPNPEWKKVVEYIGEPFWSRVKEMHKAYKEEVSEHVNKLKISLAAKVAQGEFRAFRHPYLKMIHVIPVALGTFVNHEFKFFPNGQNDLNYYNAFFTLLSIEEGKLEEVKEPEMLQKIQEFFRSELAVMM